MVCQIHGKDESCPVVSISLIPPSNTQIGLLCPAVKVSSEGPISAKAEIDCNVCIPFIQPEIFVRVLRIVEQVLQFVSNDGFPPSQCNVCKINIHDFTGCCRPRRKISSDVESTVNVVNHNFNLTIVVVVRWSKSSPVLVIFAEVCCHCRIDGLIPC